VFSAILKQICAATAGAFGADMLQNCHPERGCLLLFILTFIVHLTSTHARYLKHSAADVSARMAERLKASLRPGPAQLAGFAGCWLAMPGGAAASCRYRSSSSSSSAILGGAAAAVSTSCPWPNSQSSSSRRS
jgi:hypothetical protein